METAKKIIVIQIIKEKDIWVQGLRNADFIGWWFSQLPDTM